MPRGGSRKVPRWSFAVILLGLLAVAVLLPMNLERTRVDAAVTSAAPPIIPAPRSGNPALPIAVVMGDSWAEGSGADRAGGGFADQVAQAEGWRLINASQGGTGYVTDGPANYPDRSPLPDRVTDVVAQHPDVVVVAAGINDVGRGYTADQVTAAVDATLRPLHQQLPQAVIAVIGVFWPNEQPIDSAVQVDGIIRAEAAKLGLPFVSPIQDHWITGTNDGTRLGNRTQYIGPGADGYHPTQAGHDYLARKIEAFVSTVPNVPHNP